MSIVYSDTTNKNGIIQLIERSCGFKDADISGNATLLAQFTGDVNVALDYIYACIFSVGGTWQFDDSNHTKYPILTTNLVASQRDYSFTTDEQSNLILDIYKVVIATSSAATTFQEIFPLDVQSQSNADTEGFYDGTNVTGVPYCYDKTANGFFLQPIPSYSATGGLKVYFNREASYFTVGDTTKKAGFAGLFHEYLALRPSWQYAYRQGLSSAKALQVEMLAMEDKIKKYYGERERDVRHVMSGTPRIFR